ncbi:inorganic pyrophosphatase [Rhodococcus oxybenzonivorans]|uniref:Inorganic pyrophosphatase n=1 Tax=Rhodococcus oxybenzonivorans TaxID=1990687 RepID=A0A2S2C2D5_9NOCA|nr:inorganic pyrophosphatase [Rhodococcus oxybenzonivorans]AWK75041.1 inorganic pyrophosphatase [Rhodococcus oxybenzonivorans]
MSQTVLMQMSFFDALDRLVSSAEMRIDRPKGTAHPRYPSVIYPLDYGYLIDTTAVDGEGVDLFRGTNSTTGITAVALTVDTMKRDVEVKILVNCTPTEIDRVAEFLTGSLRLGATIVHR